MHGVVKFFNRDRGYGGIDVKGNANPIFVHVSDIADASELPLVEGEKVEFEIREDQSKKRETAANVQRLERRCTGVVQTFEKGHGKIKTQDSNETFFVHNTNILGRGFRTLEPGEIVEFTVSKGERGLQATLVYRDTRPPLLRVIYMFFILNASREYIPSCYATQVGHFP